MESLLRGGAPMKLESEKTFVLDTGYQMLEKATSNSMYNYVLQFNVEQCLTIANSAVKLHNKVRMLTQDTYTEMRAVFKAVSAWLLNHFTPSSKLNSSDGYFKLIKMLSRASQELQLFPRSKQYSIICSRRTVELWKSLDIEKISLTLPPLELTEIKTSIFQCYLDLLMQSTSTEEKCNCVLSGLALVQTLPKGLKITFIVVVMETATKFTDEKEYTAAIDLFRIVIQVLDHLLLQFPPTKTNSTSKTTLTTTSTTTATATAINNSIDDNDMNSNNMNSSMNQFSLIEILKVKVKAQLALAHIYNEMK